MSLKFSSEISRLRPEKQDSPNPTFWDLTNWFFHFQVRLDDNDRVNFFGDTSSDAVFMKWMISFGIQNAGLKKLSKKTLLLLC